jgi:hypothetical protein
MKVAKTAIVIGLIGIVSTLSQAAIVSTDVTIGSGSYILRDNSGVPLTVGNSTVNGDGALIFLGYYTDGTMINPFGSSDNNFVRLTGVGNTFGNPNTTVGDFAGNTPAPGEFFISGPPGLLLSYDNVNPNPYPTAGTPLVVRIIDKTAAQGGEGVPHYKLELANTSFWTWVTPNSPSPTLSIDLDDGSLRVLDATGRTSTPISGGGNLNANVLVPEPSAFALQAMVALCGFFGRTRGRRRK